MNDNAHKTILASCNGGFTLRRATTLATAGLLGLVAVAANAGTSQSEDAAQRLTEVTALAGAPVDSFRYARINSFEPIGLSDLLVYTTIREGYLLHLDIPCQGMDFDPFLNVSSRMHRISAGFDSVHVRNNPVTCRIKQIRPIDVVKLKQSDKDRKAAEASPTAQGG